VSTADQLSLLDLAPVGAHRRRDPSSATEAAATCDAARQRDQILRLLGSTVHGWTADELGAAMRPLVHRSTVASRLAQLRSDGLCEPFGMRPNERGRNVQTWVRTYPRWITVETNGRL
jgi:predicted ArsR family transcriptional regulator